ncbi:hypothetical protein LCGC14_2864330 [marine sediment metagenome]|uniref:Uncharacterized protein n=1 Tax=marine sediment metagenome TaxID=412755 RepID=A0A0F8Y544_9ZZZZ
MTLKRAQEVLGPIRLHFFNRRYLLDQKLTTVNKIIVAAQERLMQIGGY